MRKKRYKKNKGYTPKKFDRDLREFIKRYWWLLLLFLFGTTNEKSTKQNPLNPPLDNETVPDNSDESTSDSHTPTETQTYVQPVYIEDYVREKDSYPNGLKPSQLTTNLNPAIYGELKPLSDFQNEINNNLIL